MKPGLIIGLDFDGTCVTHEFPKIGKELPYCVDTLKKINDAGGKIILWTMRSNHTVARISDDPDIHTVAGDYLDDAINWFNERGIKLWGINENPEQKTWTASPKAYCNIYVDDAAAGCPLILDDMCVRPYVDWTKIDSILFN